jgi:type IV fimbrial biogenesis protein FimT
MSTAACGIRRRALGFTIIEIMMVIVLMAVMVMLAAPSMRTMIISNQIRSFNSALLNDMALSRSESSRRSQRVVMCPSTDQTSCTSGAAWTDGWIAFVDADSNGTRNTGGTTEPLLRVKDSSPTSISVSASGVTDIRFRSIGVVDAARTLTICPATTGTGVAGRQISITTLGRVQSMTVTCP